MSLILRLICIVTLVLSAFVGLTMLTIYYDVMNYWTGAAVSLISTALAVFLSILPSKELGELYDAFAPLE
jgi:hypothetical protein